MPRSPTQPAAEAEGRDVAPQAAAPSRHWLRLSMLTLFAAPLVLAVLHLPPTSMIEPEAAPDGISAPCSKPAEDEDVASGASLISSSKVLGVGPALGGMDPFSELTDESEEAMLAIDEDEPEESLSAPQQRPNMPPLPEAESCRAKRLQAAWLLKAPAMHDLGARLRPWLLLFVLIVGGHQWYLHSAIKTPCPVNSLDEFEDPLDEFEDLGEPIKDPKLRVRRTELSDEYDCTALHVAAHNGDVATAKVLLDGGSDVNAREAWDETPLHFAARRGSAEMCSLLLDAGADVNASNEAGVTPLIEAARARQEPTCNVLLDHGGHTGGLTDDKVPPMLGALLTRRILTEAATSLPTTATSD